MPSTNWGTTAINSMSYVAQYDSLSNILMEDAVCRMDDSTYTMDDAKVNAIAINSTTWS